VYSGLDIDQSDESTQQKPEYESWQDDKQPAATLAPAQAEPLLIVVVVNEVRGLEQLDTVPRLNLCDAIV
jgi:hypothetical protein